MEPLTLDRKKLNNKEMRGVGRFECAGFHCGVTAELYPSG
jgi:hypothetical protein